MRGQLSALLALTLQLLLVPIAGFAHHGGAAYDMSKITTLQGTVTDFEFINPHVEIYFQATDENGTVQKWDGEASNTLALHRHGWTSKSLKTGDVVTILGNRAKNGTNVLRLKKVVLPDGTELNPYPSDD